MIDLVKNIRELLKNTIFAHPDDVEENKTSLKEETPKKKTAKSTVR